MAKQNALSMHLKNMSLLMILFGGLSAQPALAQKDDYDYQQSCLLATKSELGITDRYAISRKIGVQKLGIGEYAFYLNINMGTSANRADDYSKVFCRTSGFGKVSELVVSEGQWAFVGPREDNEKRRLVSGR